MCGSSSSVDINLRENGVAAACLSLRIAMEASMLWKWFVIDHGESEAQKRIDRIAVDNSQHAVF